jgi:hypothetical protein
MRAGIQTLNALPFSLAVRGAGCRCSYEAEFGHTITTEVFVFRSRHEELDQLMYLRETGCLVDKFDYAHQTGQLEGLNEFTSSP